MISAVMTAHIPNTAMVAFYRDHGKGSTFRIDPFGRSYQRLAHALLNEPEWRLDPAVEALGWFATRRR